MLVSRQAKKHWCPKGPEREQSNPKWNAFPSTGRARALP